MIASHMSPTEDSMTILDEDSICLKMDDGKMVAPHHNAPGTCARRTLLKLPLEKGHSGCRGTFWNLDKKQCRLL